VVVKKGDTLSGLAARYGSSVSTIQKANGMRDTKLAIGRSLVIPRL
jgi:N-acetylmuramoyl-L-alanine amidase